MSDLKNTIEELGGFKACELIRIVRKTGGVSCRFKDKEINFKLYVNRVVDFIDEVKKYNNNVVVVENEDVEVIEDLIGKTLVSVETYENEMLIMKDTEGTRYIFKHFQNCCEIVEIEDICGDLGNLVGSPITMAEETYSEKEVCGLEGWTFYKFATLKGYVTVRWYGRTSSCYSVGVDLIIRKDGDNSEWY